MSNQPIIRCSICDKIYFDIGQDVCPYCKNKPKDDLQIFNDLFGDDNPFKDVGVT